MRFCPSGSLKQNIWAIIAGKDKIHNYFIFLNYSIKPPQDNFCGIDDNET